MTRDAAAHGAVAWAVYGVTEGTAAILLPIAVDDRQLVGTGHWAFSAVSLVLYTVLGGLLGALGGRWPAIARGRQATRAGRFAIAGLAAVCTLQSWLRLGASDPLSRGALGVGAVVLISAFLARRGDGPSAWLPSADPWRAAVVLVLVPIAFDTQRFAATGMPYFRIVSMLAIGLVVVSCIGRVLFVSSTGGWRLGRLAVSVGVVVPLVVLLALAGVRFRDPLRELEPPGAARGDLPAVIFVVLDTVRADHMSVYGYGRSTTPFLSEFAKVASLYRSATATSNYTLPSHASMFTGLYPRSHGATKGEGEFAADRRLADKFTTLAEILAERGIPGYAVCANGFYLTPSFGLGQGFALWDNRLHTGFFPGWGRHFLRRSVAAGVGLLDLGVRLDTWERPGAEVTDGVLAALDRSGRREEVLLFANYMDAHGPYIVPERFIRPLRAPSVEADDELISLVGRDDITVRQRLDVVARYDGAIAYLDEQVRLLVGGLKDRGLYDSALIVVTSDHGEAFGEHRILGHSNSLYAHQIGVPLIVKYPGQTEGKIVDSPVSHVDILPTVLDVLGIEAPTPVQGVSLVGAGSREDRFLVAEGVRRLSRTDWSFDARQWALVSRDWKLISSSDGAAELYHTAEDPAESRDLFDPLAEGSAEALERLEKWFDDTPLEEGSSDALDPGVRRRLKAQGYLR